MSEPHGSTWVELRAGWRDALALTLSVGAWGLVWGLIARQAGLLPWEAVAMSAFMLAGASQFVALPMMVSGQPPLLVIITVYFVNLRHYLMAASLAPYFRKTSLWSRTLIAHTVSDVSYALVISRWRERAPSIPYFLGAALSVNIAWVVATAVAAFFGGPISEPERYGLDFAFPAIFLALLVPLITDARTIIVAGFSAAISFVFMALYL